MAELRDLVYVLFPLLFFVVAVYLWWRASTKPWGSLLAPRLAAYLVDAGVILVLAGTWWVITGRPSAEVSSLSMKLTVVSVAYLLVRDVAGASLGKRLLRLRVTGVSPLGAGAVGRVLRNVPLALVALASLPQLDDVASVEPVSQLILYAEVFALLLTGRRIGDMLGGTKVVRQDVI